VKHGFQREFSSPNKLGFLPVCPVFSPFVPPNLFTLDSNPPPFFCFYACNFSIGNTDSHNFSGSIPPFRHHFAPIKCSPYSWWKIHSNCPTRSKREERSCMILPTHCSSHHPPSRVFLGCPCFCISLLSHLAPNLPSGTLDSPPIRSQFLSCGPPRPNTQIQNPCE